MSFIDGPCMCGGCRRCMHDQGLHCGEVRCCGPEPVEDAPGCPQCGGEATALGDLGGHVWLRCRSCGWEWDITPDTIEEMEEDAWPAK